MRRVGGFHFIEKRETFAGDMVADSDIIGVGLKAKDLKKQLAPLQMRELGNFFDDLSETHTGELNRLPERVQAEARNLSDDPLDPSFLDDCRKHTAGSLGIIQRVVVAESVADVTGHCAEFVVG